MPQTAWAIDGTPFSDFAWDARRIDSSVAPPLRGTDRKFSGVPGATFNGRVADSYTITMGMWIMGQDGGGPGRAAWIEEHERRMRLLRRLLRPDNGREFALTKTWSDDLGVHVATAMGTCDEELKIAHRGPYQSKLTFDVNLADPFFYGSEIAIPVPKDTPTTVTNNGDEPTLSLVLEFAGQLTNPLLTNSTPAPDVWVKAGTSVAVGDTVTLDVEETTARRTSDGANLIGAITHSGARAWMGLLRGDNTITLTADVGAGSATLRFREKWM